MIISFILSFLLGWLWFSPKFLGTPWANGVPGVDLENCNEKPVALAMITQALGTFGLAWVIGISISYNALFTSLLIVTTIILLIISNGKFALKNNTAVLIEAGYIATMATIMLACQYLF